MRNNSIEGCTSGIIATSSIEICNTFVLSKGFKYVLSKASNFINGFCIWLPKEYGSHFLNLMEKFFNFSSFLLLNIYIIDFLPEFAWPKIAIGTLFFSLRLEK
jgi:hypothetical protein